MGLHPLAQGVHYKVFEFNCKKIRDPAMEARSLIHVTALIIMYFALTLSGFHAHISYCIIHRVSHNWGEDSCSIFSSICIDEIMMKMS